MLLWVLWVEPGNGGLWFIKLGTVLVYCVIMLIPTWVKTQGWMQHKEDLYKILSCVHINWLLRNPSRYRILGINFFLKMYTAPHLGTLSERGVKWPTCLFIAFLWSMIGVDLLAYLIQLNGLHHVLPHKLGYFMFKSHFGTKVHFSSKQLACLVIDWIPCSGNRNKHNCLFSFL